MCNYVSGLGQPPFDPRMMVSLLLHGYASGLYSSRRIARACCERNDLLKIMKTRACVIEILSCILETRAPSLKSASH